MLKNKDFLVLLTRPFLGYVFFSAGICKLTHGNFGQLIGPPWLEEALAKYGLGLFAQVVAVCQVVCGALLFTQRFSTLGAIMLVPMNVSILAVTVSQNWAGTPYVNAVFLFLNLMLLLYEYKRFLFLFSPDASVTVVPAPIDEFRKGKLPWAILVAALATLAVAPFQQHALTNAAGLLTFTLAGACLIMPVLLSKLEKVILVQAIGNMFLMTLGFLSPAITVMMVNSGILFALLLVNLWLNSRRIVAIPALHATAK